MVFTRVYFDEILIFDGSSKSIKIDTGSQTGHGEWEAARDNRSSGWASIPPHSLWLPRVYFDEILIFDGSSKNIKINTGCQSERTE